MKEALGLDAEQFRALQATLQELTARVGHDALPLES
jgi:hypothetical protein